MTDEERRDWLARLRPYDRAGFTTVGSHYLHACTLLERQEPYDWAPGEWRWLVDADAHEYYDGLRQQVDESCLFPLPDPSTTGLVDLNPPRRARRRRTTSRAKAASA
jgi:hypothetical protein